MKSYFTVQIQNNFVKGFIKIQPVLSTHQSTSKTKTTTEHIYDKNILLRLLGSGGGEDLEHQVKSNKRGRGVGNFDTTTKRAICKRDPILSLNRPHIQTCNTVIHIFNIRVTICRLYTIQSRLEICIDITFEISEVDHYTWIFTYTIFRLALEITFLLNKYFFLRIAYELLSQRVTYQGLESKDTEYF